MKAHALAAAIAALAAIGCGGENPTAAVPSPPPQKAAPPPVEQGETRSGTLSVPALVAAPAPAGRVIPVSKVARRPAKPVDPGRVRKAHLAVLRAHCATRPENDPRCNGTRVNERVALETAR